MQTVLLLHTPNYQPTPTQTPSSHTHNHPYYTHHHTPSSFKQYLELEPLLRDVIQKFHQSRYTSCLTTLNDMKPSLMLDMYLASHIEILYTMVRNKALIQVGVVCSPPIESPLSLKCRHPCIKKCPTVCFMVQLIPPP